MVRKREEEEEEEEDGRLILGCAPRTLTISIQAPQHC